MALDCNQNGGGWCSKDSTIVDVEVIAAVHINFNAYNSKCNNAHGFGSVLCCDTQWREQRDNV